jgi:hypothetical protein
MEAPHAGAFIRYAPVLLRSDYIGAIRPSVAAAS